MDLVEKKENQLIPPTPKTYKKPEVKKYGSIVHITAGPLTGSIDSIFGGDGGFIAGPVS